MFSKKDLNRLIIPLIIEQILAVTVGMADIMMISRAGEAAVSGVSLVDMINVLLINLFAALATGGAVVTSQLIGHRDIKTACKSANQLMIITSILSISVMVLSIVFCRGLLRLVYGDIDDDVMNNAVTYFTISALSYPFLSLYNSCAAIFRSMGNSKISMQTSALMNVLNIGLNAVFIFGCGLGVAGAAIASFIARGVAAGILIILLRNPEREIHLDKKLSLKIDKAIAKRILRIGVPNGLENSMFQLGRVLVVSVIAGFGTVQIAANAVANNIDAMGTIPGQAISLAMITVVGQCVGAGDYEQARFYIKKLLKIAYGITFVLNSCILISLPLILKIYNLSNETIVLATILIFIHNGCAMIFWPLSFTLPNALRASNDVKFTMVVSIFSMWTFRIVLSYVIGKYMGYGAIGVWIAMVLDWIFRVICFVARYLSGKWTTFAK